RSGRRPRGGGRVGGDACGVGRGALRGRERRGRAEREDGDEDAEHGDGRRVVGRGGPRRGATWWREGEGGASRVAPIRVACRFPAVPGTFLRMKQVAETTHRGFATICRSNDAFY